MASKRRPNPIGRLLAVVAVIAAGIFAVQGGEYTTLDLFRQRDRADSLRRDIDSLKRDVDSLKAFREALRKDPIVQERVARELYGLVRGDKELVYRFIDEAGPSKP